MHIKLSNLELYIELYIARFEHELRSPVNLGFEHVFIHVIVLQLSYNFMFTRNKESIVLI